MISAPLPRSCKKFDVIKVVSRYTEDIGAADQSFDSTKASAQATHSSSA